MYSLIALMVALAAISHHTLAAIVSWSVLAERMKQAKAAKAQAQPAPESASANKSRRRLEFWMDISGSCLSIAGLLAMLWFFLTIPRSDPRWFMVFLSIIVILTLQTGRKVK